MRAQKLASILAMAVAAMLMGLTCQENTDNLANEDYVRGPLEFPDDPYMPAAREARPAVPAAAPLRGPYVSAQVNVDSDGNNIVGDAANEPSIAVDPTNPNHMAIGWRQFDTIASNFRQAGWGYTTDGGRTWTFPGVLEPGVFRSDPVLDFTADGDFFYNSLVVDDDDNYSCTIFKSVNGGMTWDAGVYAYGGDKAWMAIDRTGGIGDGNIYHAWDYAGCCGDNWFTRSTDGGLTYEFPVPVPGRPIWGVTTVGPDGEVYVAGRLESTGSQFVVAKSTTVQDPMVAMAFDFAQPIDLGGSLRYFVDDSPNPEGLLGQVWIATDHSTLPTRGNVYVLASVDPPGDDPLDLHFIRSTDGGVSWSVPIRINDDAAGTNAWQWFGTLAVAPNGRIDVIWNDTRNDPGGYDSELYYSYSTDAGGTWSVNEALSVPFDPHLGWPQQNKLGDYYHMVSDLVGAHVAYAATFNGEQDVYYLRIGDYDCNNNGVGDETDIADGTSDDCQPNGIPDECETDCNDNSVPDDCDIAQGT
ncbi:MAG: exo-alpha-sialidase, partial [Phycisphaerales bacterium]